MKIVAKTDTGKVRASNQDAYAAGELPNGVAWAVVCDGMGGAAGGNVASTTAVKIISEQISSKYRENMSSRSIKNMLFSAIIAANVSVYEISCSNEELRGMGTTVVACILAGNEAYIAHAGDSRAYILHENDLTQLTRDHSMVQDLVEIGKITQDEAKHHPRKNIITRAVGVDQNIDIDFCVEELKDEDTLLICTDGLTNYVDIDEIREITAENSFYGYAESLVRRANENGGGDNITVVALAY
ncbi:MAG: Stp1/IreP family PP2C-type Ser/Thr phosphatase [Clostridia bacterium]|nr:Stp1/IreP family PP2C-type Ser/Thr phosphatase [Clostridia bacterium]